MPDSLDSTDLKHLFISFSHAMNENRDHLITLDSIMGDGDLGITMARAFSAAREELAASEETNPGKMLILAGMAMARAAPSTMGTLLATGFMRGGKAVASKVSLNLADMAVFFKAFTQGIADRGKAMPGEKTIIDMLQPVSESLSAASEQGCSLAEAFVHAELVAERALEEVSGMKARHGRAAYYQDDSVGKQDAGSVVGLLLVKSIKTFLSGF